MAGWISRAIAGAVFVSVLTAGSLAGAMPVPVQPSGVDPQVFPPSQSCMCHGDLVNQWSGSMHAQALTDPVYRAKVDEANAATEGDLGAFCDTCHGPAATMTGELAAGVALSEGTAESIGCMFCHQVTGLAEGEPGNVSQLLEVDGVRRAQLEQPVAPHPAEYSELHTTAEICGGCHNVNHPVNGMHLEATYTEWSESDYAKQGIVCQDCHMSEKPGVIGPSKGMAAAGGLERDNIYRMSFVGANVAQSDSEAATALLKSAATIDIEAPEVIAAGEETSATVTITNVGAGHYLPTGLTEVRQMWLEVAVQDSSGTTTVAERRFETILQDDEGNAPVELWEATGIKSDDRVPPKGSVSEDVVVALPPGADKATLVATLYYQSVPDELAKKAGVENPVTTMASASQDLFGSQEARDAAVTQPPAENGGIPLVPLVAGVVVALAVSGGIVFWRRRKAA